MKFSSLTSFMVVILLYWWLFFISLDLSLSPVFPWSSILDFLFTNAIFFKCQIHEHLFKCGWSSHHYLKQFSLPTARASFYLPNWTIASLIQRNTRLNKDKFIIPAPIFQCKNMRSVVSYFNFTLSSSNPDGI